MARLIKRNQATAARRRVFFHLVDATDGLTPETGEAGGQPQISTNGGAFTNTGIGTLTAIGNGRYYGELTQAAVATVGDVIETRYKSANTAEAVGDQVHVVGFDPDDAFALGLGLQDLIESRYGHHTAQSRVTVYVDPVNGGTIAGGYDGTREKPLSTVTEALTTVGNNQHAIIFLLALNGSSRTTLTEAVTISNTQQRFLSIRGPGRDFLWTRSGAGNTIAISGVDGVSLSGFQVGTAGTGTGDGINVATCDFFHAHELWINNTQGHAINLSACDNAIIRNCHLQGSGVSGSGHGINLGAGAGDSVYNVIRDCIIDDVQGDGIRVMSGTVTDTKILGNVINGCTGYGVNLLGGSHSHLIGNRYGNNTSGNVNDSGANTVREDTFGDVTAASYDRAGTFGEKLNDIAAAPTAAAIADAVWEEAIADHSGVAGSTAEALASVVGITGLRSLTLQTRTAGLAAIPGVTLGIYTSDNLTLLTTLTTDSNGNASLAIDDGSYKVRIYKAQYSFTTPATLTVSADATETFTGTAFNVSSPSSPTLCVVYGTVTNANGVAVSGATVRARANTATGTGVIAQSTEISETSVTTTTNGSGYFELELVRGASVLFEIPACGIATEKTVPSAASQDVATW